MSIHRLTFFSLNYFGNYNIDRVIFLLKKAKDSVLGTKTMIFLSKIPAPQVAHLGAWSGARPPPAGAAACSCVRTSSCGKTFSDKPDLRRIPR
jgi:hypothetical protein